MKFKAILFAGSFFLATGINAQDKNDEKLNQLKTLIESKQYTFVAERVLPMTGRNRQLTSPYQVELRSDTLKSDLPYFGRAYTATLDPSEAGIQFTSTDFEYKAVPRKKGGWDVLIKPKDARNVNQFSLDITRSGRASLQVVSNSRQPISFTGYITEVKTKK